MKRAAADSDRENRSVPNRQRDAERASGPSKTEASSVASLHRSVGNQAVKELRETGEFQTNLDVSDPNDRAEREARRVADRVMRMPDPTAKVDTQERAPSDGVQRMCSRCQRRYAQDKPLNCRECEAELQQAPTGETPDITADVSGDVRLQRMCAECTNRLKRGEPLNCPECEKELQRTPSSGRDSKETRDHSSDRSSRQPGGDSLAFEARKAGVGRRLDPATRRSLEPRFGYDFGGVRIHTGRRPDELSRSINARAFTRGSDIYFAHGEYQPNTPSGRRLLAHELTHTIQQGAVKPLGAGRDARPDSSTSVTRTGEDRAFRNRRSSTSPEGGVAVAINDLGSTVERPGIRIQRAAKGFSPPDRGTVKEGETSRPTDEKKKDEEEGDGYGWLCSQAKKRGWFVPWSKLKPYTMQEKDQLPGPAEVYPSDPTTLNRGAIFEASGAQCRGACGIDCSKCDREEIVGFHKTGQSVTRADYSSPDTWTYEGFYTCPTHDACVEHDACFDYSANEEGETGWEGFVIGPQHWGCNLKCVCDYSVIECVNFINGGSGDDTMFFAEEVHPPSGQK